MERELPGFYYDEAKKKYFRISADHKAAKLTAAAEYSKSVIKQRKQAAKATNVQREHALKEYAALVVRSKLVWDPFYSLTLARESARLPLLTSGDIWSHAFSTKRLFNTVGARHDSNGFDYPTGGIADIAYHDESGYVYFSTSSHLFVQHKASGSPCKSVTLPFAAQDLVPRGCRLELTGKSHPLLFVGEPGGQLYFNRLYDQHISVLNPIKVKPCGDMHDWSFSNDFSNQVRVAVASQTPQILTIERNSRLFLASYPELRSSGSETLSVAWQTRNTLAWGHRNGKIALTDTRTDELSLRLQHPSSIRKIRNIGHTGNYVLAAGLRDTLAMYDLRWCPSPSHSEEASPPYVFYDDYRNSSRVSRIGFDVSSSLGLVAAAMDTGGVRLFDLWTGRSRSTRWPAMSTVESDVSVIKFARDIFEEQNTTDGFGYCLLGFDDHIDSLILGQQPTGESGD